MGVKMSFHPDLRNLVDEVILEIKQVKQQQVQNRVAKLEELRRLIDFEKTLNIAINPEDVQLINKLFEELLVLLIKNKNRLDEEVLEKSDRIMEDIGSIFKLIYLRKDDIKTLTPRKLNEIMTK